MKAPLLQNIVGIGPARHVLLVSAGLLLASTCSAADPCLGLSINGGGPLYLVNGRGTNFYSITNCGPTAISNVTVFSDIGTPVFAGDDVVIVNGVTVQPNEKVKANQEILLVAQLCATNNSTLALSEIGTLTAQKLADGNIRATLVISTNLNDNSYGTNAVGWGATMHRFSNLTGTDQAEFEFRNGAGASVLRFRLDYISASGTFPSGFGSLGVDGGDGSLITGNASDVLSFDTSLTENLNKQPFLNEVNRYAVDSPALSSPEAAFWEYRLIYTMVVSSSAFGASGFGSVAWVGGNNTPAKASFSPQIICDSCLTNTANAGGQSGLVFVSATASSPICASPPPPTLTIERDSDTVVIRWQDTNYSVQYTRVLANPPLITPWITLGGPPPKTLGASGPELFLRLIRNSP